MPERILYIADSIYILMRKYCLFCTSFLLRSNYTVTSLLWNIVFLYHFQYFRRILWENTIVLKVIQTNVHTFTGWLPIASCLVSSPIYHVVSWNHGVILLDYDDKNTTKALSQCLWSLWQTLKDVDFVLRLFYIPTPRAASCCESLTSALIPWVLLCALCDDTFTL